MGRARRIGQIAGYGGGWGGLAPGAWPIPSWYRSHFPRKPPSWPCVGPEPRGRRQRRYQPVPAGRSHHPCRRPPGSPRTTGSTSTAGWTSRPSGRRWGIAGTRALDPADRRGSAGGAVSLLATTTRSGASTITQQARPELYLSPSKPAPEAPGGGDGLSAQAAWGRTGSWKCT